MTKHTKAFRCRIDNAGRIHRLKENWKIPIHMSSEPEAAVDLILDKFPNENIVIKTEKSATSMIFSGSRNKPYIRSGGKNPPLKDTTRWLYLIKNDGTVYKIIDNGKGERFVGEKVK